MKSWSLVFSLVMIMLLGCLNFADATSKINDVRTVQLNAPGSSSGYTLFYQVRDSEKSSLALRWVQAEKAADGTWLIPSHLQKTAFRLEHPKFGSTYTRVILQDNNVPYIVDFDGVKMEAKMDKQAMLRTGKMTLAAPTAKDRKALPPPGADCATAGVITTFPFTDTGNTCSLGADSTPSCGYSSWPYGGWYTFTAATGGSYTASLCGSSYDTYIAIFSGSCAALTCITYNDDYCGLQSQVNFTAAVGTTYYILVGGYSSGCGSFILNVSAPVPPPTNDDCVTAETVAVPSLTNGSTVGGSLGSPAAPNCDGYRECGNSVWYHIVGTGYTITASTCSNSSGGSANNDNYMMLYCKSCDELQCIMTNDDDPACLSSGAATLTWCSEPGADYYILVAAYYCAQDVTFVLDVSDDGTPCTGAAPCLPTGACCTCIIWPYNCTIASEITCAAMGSTWLGADVPCIDLNEIEQFFVSAPGLPITGYSPCTTDTITVPVGTGTVSDVNIRMEISHPYVGDMWIDIVHNGSTQNIWAQVCGYFDNIMATSDDTGWSIYCTEIGGGPSEDIHMLLDPGVYCGYGDLAAYEGGTADGTWQIIICDYYPWSDNGILLEWAVELSAPGVIEYPCGTESAATPTPVPGTPIPGDEDEDEEI